jgi:hypothetical protein
MVGEVRTVFSSVVWVLMMVEEEAMAMVEEEAMAMVVVTELFL